MFRRQLNRAMVRITNSNIMNKSTTEQTIPEELTVTVPNSIVYNSHGNGNLTHLCY